MKHHHLYKQLAGQALQPDAVALMLVILIYPETLAVMIQVSLKKYGKTSPNAFGLTGRKTIAIVRSSGRLPACCAGPDLVSPLCSMLQLIRL